MFRFLSVFSALFTVSFFGFFGGCQAQNSTTQAQEDVIAEKLEIPESHATVFTAFDMAERAASRRDRDTLLKAAELLETMGAQPLGRNDNAAKNWTILARSMGPNDGNTAVPFRGRVKGPAYRQTIIEPGETDSLSEIYYAAEVAELSLKSTTTSDGKAGLVWVVKETDASASPICRQTVLGKAETCEFTPLWTGQYSIEITNTSQHALTYLFVTN